MYYFQVVGWNQTPVGSVVPQDMGPGWDRKMDGETRKSQTKAKKEVAMNRKHNSLVVAEDSDINLQMIYNLYI